MGPYTDVEARQELGAALAREDGAGAYELPAVALDPEPLAMAVPTVAGATNRICLLPVPASIVRLRHGASNSGSGVIAPF